MSDSRRLTDGQVLLVIVGTIAAIGVSSAVSPWLDEFYSEIAVWVLGAGVVIGGIWAAFKFGPDPELGREIRKSKVQNATAVAVLEAKHAAHPEVAKELAERMLAEKLARLQAEGLLPPVSPPTKG